MLVLTSIELLSIEVPEARTVAGPSSRAAEAAKVAMLVAAKRMLRWSRRG